MKSKSVLVVSGMSFIACLMAGCSAVPGSSSAGVKGKVSAVYVEHAPQIFVDTRLAPVDLIGRLWVDVQLDTPAPDGRKVARAQLGEFVDVSQGDLVEVAWSDKTQAATPVAVPHRVVAVLDKADTIAADPSFVKASVAAGANAHRISQP